MHHGFPWTKFMLVLGQVRSWKSIQPIQAATIFILFLFLLLFLFLFSFLSFILFFFSLLDHVGCVCTEPKRPGT